MSLHSLSAFGGDFFVAPNPIDFDKVFAAFGNLAETGNFVVLSTVCVILGLYVIALVFARKEDKQDELRVSTKSIFLTEIKQWCTSWQNSRGVDRDELKKGNVKSEVQRTQNLTVNCK